MLNIVISFLTFVLILISLFMVLVILMQRGSSSGGMGSAFGGGVAESAFGAETTNILTRATKWSAVAFFLIALTLYLLYMGREGVRMQPAETDLLDIAAGETVPDAAPETTAAVLDDDEARPDLPETTADATTTTEVPESPGADSTEVPESVPEETVPAPAP